MENKVVYFDKKSGIFRKLLGIFRNWLGIFRNVLGIFRKVLGIFIQSRLVYSVRINIPKCGIFIPGKIYQK